MAVACAETASQQPLRAQVWILKVSIHCEGCKRKVKKVLQSIDGVYTTTIDSEQQKVTVTGNVSLETLTKRLEKAGKRAEIWPEKPAGKEKQFIKMLETDKGGQENGRSPSTNKASAKKVEFKVNPVKNNNREEQQIEKSKKKIGSSPKKPPAGEAPAPASNSNGNNTTGNEGCSPDKSGEKKKRKGQPGNNSSDKSGSNLQNGQGILNMDQDMGLRNGNPLAQQIYTGPKGYYFTPPIMGLNYNAPHLGKGPEFLYHVPPIPFSYSYDQTGNYEDQGKPQTYLDYFSEENAHGCFIM